MASVGVPVPTHNSGKMPMEVEAGGAGAATPAHEADRRLTLCMADLTLRLLLFATTLTSIVVTAVSNQTKLVAFPLLPFPILFKAKFTHSPAIIYLVTALSVACLYSLLSSVVSGFSISRPTSPRLLLSLACIDAVMAGVVASATGAVASIAYVALRGNSHVGWRKVCDVFDKFCQHVAASIIISLLSSIILVLLVMASTYSLYLRSRH